MPREIDNNFMLQCLRHAQWEKCKGELNALLSMDCCRKKPDSEIDDVFDLFRDFIKQVDENELWN